MLQKSTRTDDAQSVAISHLNLDIEVLMTCPLQAHQEILFPESGYCVDRTLEQYRGEEVPDVEGGSRALSRFSTCRL
jgi:hypothetical protein